MIAQFNATNKKYISVNTIYTFQNIFEERFKYIYIYFKPVQIQILKHLHLDNN